MLAFAKNVFKLTSGSLIAQALGVLVSPLLTRLFAPEAFGIAGLFVAITSIITVFACSQYDLAIMLPKANEQAANLLAGALISTIIISCLTAFLVFVAKSSILKIFNTPQLADYIWFIPPMVFFLGFFSAFQYWNSRGKRFGRLALIRIVNSLSANTFKLAMGFCGYVSGGVLIGAIFVGQFIASSLLGIKAWSSDKQLFIRHIRPSEIIHSLRRYKRFPQYVIWSSFLVDLSLKLPVFMIAYFFSPKTLGFFVFTQSVLRLPVSTIGQAISQVFFQKAASIVSDKERLCVFVESIFHFLLTFMMFPMLLLTILGHDIFEFIFGRAWVEAGVYAQILSCSILIQFISSPISSLFNVLEKQKEVLLFDVLLMAIRCTALVSGGLTGSIILTITFFVVGDIIGRCAKFHYIFKVAGLKRSKIILVITKTFGLAAPFLIFVLLTKHMLALHGVPVLLFSFFMLLGNYSWLVYKIDSFRNMFSKLIFLSQQ